jgi:hypothetical protein
MLIIITYTFRQLNRAKERLSAASRRVIVSILHHPRITSSIPLPRILCSILQTA